MKSREIIDYAGWETGAAIKSYAWKSQPTRGPFTGKPIRAIVVKDESGRLWGGIRLGASATEKARNEFWPYPFDSIKDAVVEARHSARETLSDEADMYSQKMRPNAQPGKEIVRVTMDDGWSVAINAPEKPATPSPAFTRVLKLFEEFGSNKKSPERPRPRGRSIDR